MTNFIKFVNASTNSIVLVENNDSSAEMFRDASTQGIEMGRTSFNNLLKGKVEMVKGWVIAVEVAPEVSNTDNAVELLNKLQVELSSIGKELKIKEAKTETYATLKTEDGRLQFNPKKNGSFSVMFFSNKGAETTLGLEVETAKSQYSRLKPLDLASIVTALSK